MWCQLSSSYLTDWKIMDLPNYSFKGHCVRDALVVENKIVYFGSSDKYVTFVLEEEEGEQLKVVTED